MGFERAFGRTSPKQENSSNSSNLLVAALPFMASTSGNSQSTQPVFDQQHHQQQQMQQNQQFQEPHHHHHQQNNQITFGMMQASSSSNNPSNFMTRDTEALDLADMDPTLLYMDCQEPPQIQEQRQNSTMTPPTLSMFPSQPMHVEPPPSTQATNGVGSPSTSGSMRPSEPWMELSNPGNNGGSSVPEPSKTAILQSEGNRKDLTSSSDHESPKSPDPKTLRRLAQNREAARKTRLRKKAYVQQLESSRIRLTQLEQEIQRARAQGFYFGGSALLGGDQGLPVAKGNISSDAAVFDMEYGRWLEDHNRLMHELRTAVQEHVPDNQLAIYVDNCLSHYDQVLNLKGMMAKSDVFHLVSGMWRTPAERCFMWMGGFRPSDLIKIILNPIEPFSDQQLLDICGLQQSTQENEEALNHGLQMLNQSVSDTIAADALSSPLNMANHMNQMVMAMNRLTSIEDLIRQADHLRHTVLHRLHQILTTRQTARCLLAVYEYFHRLRALSSLWMARTRQG